MLVKRELIQNYHGPFSGEGLEETSSVLQYFSHVRRRLEPNDQNMEVSESDESAALSSSLLLRQVDDPGESAVIWNWKENNYTWCLAFLLSIHKPAKCRKNNLDKVRFSPITSTISFKVWRTISEIFSSSLLSSLSLRFRRKRRKRSARLRSTYFTELQSDHEVSEKRSSIGKWRSSKAFGIAVMSKCCQAKITVSFPK